jgi:hypothetical protein
LHAANNAADAARARLSQTPKNFEDFKRENANSQLDLNFSVTFP